MSLQDWTQGKQILPTGRRQRHCEYGHSPAILPLDSESALGDDASTVRSRAAAAAFEYRLEDNLIGLRRDAHTHTSRGPSS